MHTSSKHWSLDIIHPDAPRGAFRYAIFDFDGTISLIREGWQQIMIPYFTDELMKTPKGATLPRAQLEELVRDFVFLLTGKQTIYQCMQMAEEVEKLGGQPLEPLAYKAEYQRRLSERIQGRIDELTQDPSAAIRHIVPGSIDFLDALKKQNIIMYLASGTDEPFVLREAALLGVDHYFAGIYGAQDDYKTFSKKMVIDRIIRENSLRGSELIGFGDGYVEIENVKEVGGFACGVATDETRRVGRDEWKYDRLVASGADVVIPDFTDTPQLMRYLFPQG